MHHEQHYHDQCTQQHLNVVQVGLGPETAHAREAQVRVEALNAVAQFHQQTQKTQRVAEVSVLGAEQRVAQVQVEATVAIHQLNAQHHEELNRLQQIANQANTDLTLQLRRAEEENPSLTERLNSQQHELTEQRTRFDEMQTTMLSLQNQLTIVRHQSPVITPQNGADMSELQGCIDALRAEVRQLQQDSQRRSTIYSAAPPFVTPSSFNIATPVRTPNVATAVSPEVSPSRSACAGYPPTRDQVYASHVPPDPPGTSSSSSSSEGKPRKDHSAGSPVSTGFPSPSQGNGLPYGFPGGGRGSPGDGRNDVLGFGYAQHNTRSVGAGSFVLHDENSVYKTKDLQLVVIQTLPTDAAQFRGWRHSFLTKASAIDKTGQNHIMTWLLEAFSANTTVEQLEITSLQMPSFRCTFGKSAHGAKASER